MMVDEEKEIEMITSAVNAHGILFKKGVRHELEMIPNVTIIGEEYPVRFEDGAQLDLLVQYKPENKTYLVVIECKRAYATSKKWVFFESPEKRTKLPYFFRGNELRVGDGMFFTRSMGIPICIEGIEIDLLKYKKTDDAYKIGSIDRIWQTANQVCRGYHNLLASELDSRSQNVNSSPLLNYEIFPLIITTAELLVCPIKHQNAELLSGNSIGHLHLKSIPYVILNHAFTPSSVGRRKYLKVNLSSYQNLIERGAHAQEGIIIVSVNNILEFFKLLN